MRKTSDDDGIRKAVALFRYGLIADLIHLPRGAPGVGERLREKAGRDHDIPGTCRTRVAAETIRHWLQLYRRGGFDALVPRPRTDRGRPRRLPAEVVETLVSIKTAHPRYSVRAVIDSARERGIGDVHLAPSTVHRLLAREGLLDRSDPPADADRRRFAYRDAGELWMSDVMHGPAVPRRTPTPQDLPDRVYRRCHPRCPLRRLRLLREHRRLPAGAQAGSDPAGDSQSDYMSITGATTAPTISPWSAPSSASR